MQSYLLHRDKDFDMARNIIQLIKAIQSPAPSLQIRRPSAALVKAKLRRRTGFIRYASVGEIILDQNIKAPGDCRLETL